MEFRIESSRKEICRMGFGGNDLWRFWKYVFYQLEMEEMICGSFENMCFINYKWIWTFINRYVWIPKGSRDSLGHQFCLTACVLGQYSSLHGSDKIDNLFSTNDSSWFTSQVGTSQSGRGRYPFRWQVLSMGKLLRGSCGTPHNDF